ncbi:MAG: protein kinase, partial [Gemmataceae bacterium]|nr:protein kinase [Gemmataceae bacterium]
MAPGENILEVLLRWEELRQQGQLLSAEELCAHRPEWVAELKWRLEALATMEALRESLQRQEAVSDMTQLEAAPDPNRETTLQVSAEQHRSGGKPSRPRRASTLVLAHQAGFPGAAVGTAETRLLRPFPASGLATAAYHPSIAPTRRLTSEEPALDWELDTTVVELPTVAGYELLGVLGQGGMGVVYKAKQIGLKRLVALKMIKAGAHAQLEELSRFRTEAEAVARLQHPNIVQIYEVGEQNGLPYFSLEFVDGGSLAQTLNGTPQAPLPTAQRMELLARAIHVAHEQGIIHRDLKPANVLLTAADVPKITDFGLAKRLDVETGQTQNGVVMGTPCYMAPEQATGQVRAIGPGTDIYALGAILYELLTGRPPFQGASLFETLDQVRTREPVPPSHLQPKLPRDLETICLKCLQKEPRKRYASALDLADDLHRFRTGEPIRARPVSRWERALKWTRRRPAVAGFVAATIVALLSLVTGSVYYGLYQQQKASSAEQEAIAGARRAIVRGKAEEQLRNVQALLKARDWSNADPQLSEVQALINSVDFLDDLRPQAAGYRQEIQGHEQARARYRRFAAQREKALYHLTLFTGLDPEANRQATRAAAEEALAQFGLTAAAEAPLALERSYFTDQEQSEITDGCYELLLVLAEVVAHPRELVAHLRPGQDPVDQAAQAVRLLDRASRLRPPSRTYHLRRARYLEQMQDTPAARQEHARAAELQPASALDYFWMAEEHYNQRDLNQALVGFQNALLLQPDHFWARYFLALCYLRLPSARPDQAKANLDLAKDSLTACLAQRTDFPGVYVQRGYAHSALGEYEAAERDFQQALNREPDDVTRSSIHINRGFLRFRQAEAVETVANLPYLSAWLPSLSAAPAPLARLYQQQKLEEVVADLRQALTLKPKDYQAYLNLAQAYRKQHRLVQAVAMLDEAIGHQPKLAELYRERAQLHRQRQDWKAALADFEQALQLEPRGSWSHVAHYERASILYENRRYPEAIAACEAALETRRDYPRAHQLRAGVLLQLERYAEAVLALEQCEKN